MGTTTTFITFWEEGTFELRMHVVPSFNFWADMEDVDAESVEPIESLDMNVQGQWYTQADSLFLEATTMTMTANGEDLLTVMIEAMIQNARRGRRVYRRGTRNLCGLYQADPQPRGL